MPNLPRLLVSSLAVFALVAAACGETADQGAGDEPEVTLTLANFNQAHYAETRAMEWWLDEIEKRTDGRVKFERFHGESLCEGPEIVECTRDGRADVGMTIPGYTPDTFPIAEIQTLPFLTVNGEAAMQAYQRLMEEVPEVRAETDKLGLKVLGYTMADRAIIGGNEPLESIDDLRGKSIRTVGDGAELAIKAVGGNPVSMPAHDMYEGMQRGVIDVWVNNIVGLIGTNMYEVSEYVYDPGFGLYIAVAAWMSQDVFDDLPQDIQQVIEEVTEEWIDHGAYEGYAESYDELCSGFLKEHRDQLTVWERWDDAEIQRWKDALGDTAVNNWVDKAEAQGVKDPEDVLDKYVEYLREAEEASTYASPIEECIAEFSS